MRCGERVEIKEETISHAVECVWKTGATSVRPYQQLIASLISNALRRSIEEEKQITISDEDVTQALRLIDVNSQGKRMGI